MANSSSSAWTSCHSQPQTCGTTYRRACNLRTEAPAFSEVIKASQGWATSLGHTIGNLQAPYQEEETTGCYSTTEAIQRQEEDGDEA